MTSDIPNPSVGKKNSFRGGKVMVAFLRDVLFRHKSCLPACLLQELTLTRSHNRLPRL